MGPQDSARGDALKVRAISRSLDVCPDPIALYQVLCGERRDTLLLESAESGAGASQLGSLIVSRAALRLTCRHNMVEIVPLSANGRAMIEPLIDRLADDNDVLACGDRLSVAFPLPEPGSEAERLQRANVLDAVRAVILDLEVEGEPALPPLVAGSFAYDLLGVYETLPDGDQSDNLRWPDFELVLAEELIRIQHDKRRSTVLRYAFGGEASYNDAVRALAETVDVALNVAAPEPLAGATADAEPEVDIDDDAFCALVDKLKAHIVRGDVFQIVPSRCFSLPCPDPLRAYRELRKLNPSPYMFYVRGSAGTLFGASPETALAVTGEPKRVAISPLAGTRRRGDDADLDARIEAELRLDEKEVAEHMMLVDLARNDVARVSKPGTRRVDKLLNVVRYSHVMHLRSLVTGELADTLDALHAYVATMNMGTLTGAPKLRAAELLRQNERTRRGPYGGAVGYFTAQGEMDTCIVIRSATVVDDVAYVRAGCGVVYDSDPQAEADETRRKAQAVLVALQRALS